jgi:hypothetical protein
MGDEQLGSSSVKDDREQAESVEERERESEVLELVGQDSTSDPEEREKRRFGRREGQKTGI